MIHSSYKFRIYPNKTQEIALAKHFGCNRFVFNYFLALRKKSWEEEKKSLSFFDTGKLCTQLKKELDWLKEPSASSLEFSLQDLDNAFKNFFRRIKNGENPGYPRLKKKSDNSSSFRVRGSISIKKNTLNIPKIKGIKINKTKEIEGRILFCTISKTKTGKFFASIAVEKEHIPFEKTGNSCGIDTGLKELAILSNGQKYENIKPLKKRLKKIKYEHRQLSKKQKGSKRREDQRIKLARAYEKVSNIRKDWLHKVSTEIVKNHDIICVEDLAVKNLMKNHCLAQAFSDVSLGQFYSYLEYKCKWNEKEYVKIDRFFPSSKQCHACGNKNEELTLKDRNWTCLNCNIYHDRDINAAKNILIEGLSVLSSNSDIKQKGEEAPSLDGSTSHQGPLG